MSLIRLLTCCLISSACLASDILSLDIDAAADLARQQNDRVRSARSAINTAKDLGRVDRSVFFPQLLANMQYSRLGRVETFDAFGRPQREDRDDLRSSARLDQLIYGYDLHSATKDRAQQRLQAAQAQAQLSGRDAARATRDAIASWALAKATVRIAEERLKQRQDEQKTVEALFKANLAANLDRGQSTINVITTEDSLRAARSALRQSQFDIAVLIARQPGSFTITFDLEQEPDVDALQVQAGDAIDQGPERRLLQAQHAQTEADRRLARSDRLPRLGAFAEIGTGGEDLDDQESSWALGLSLSWSLYDGGATLARESSLQHRMQEIYWQDEATIRERQRQLGKLSVRIKMLRERIQAQKQAVTIALDNYEDAKFQHSSGEIDLTRLGEFSLAIGENRFLLAQLQQQLHLVANELRALSEQ